METGDGELVVVVGPTPSLNELLRMHWAKKKQLRNWYATGIDIEARRVGVSPRAPEKGPRRVTLTRCSSRRLDRDNLVGGCKPLVDAIVDSGFAENDTADGLVVNYAQAKSSRTDAKTIVSIAL